MPRSLARLTELDRLDAEYAKRSHARDPVAFAEYLGITPDPWQARVLRESSKRLLLNCSRQSGKSTTTAILALHRALYTRGALILLVSPSSRQSKELLRKAVEFIPRLPVRPVMDVENTQSLEFANGSRILSLPSSEETVRGFSAVNLLIEDEAGDVPDELYRAIRPMLAVGGGQLILMGTPKGRRGHFFTAWERDPPSADWVRISISANECPRISPEFLAEERRALGAQYAQEYEGSFLNSATGLVYGGFDETRNCVAVQPEGSTPWTYVLGIDFGVIDDTAFTVLAFRDHDPLVYVLESFKRPMSPSEAAEEVLLLEKRFAFSMIVGDEGGLGKAFAEEMRQRFSIPIVPARKTDKHGVIALLNGDLRRGRVQFVRPLCAPLLEELGSLSWVTSAEGVTKEAPNMANHCADSLLYGWRACTAYGNRPLDIRPVTPDERISMETSAYWDRAEREVSEAKENDWWNT